jgi:Signal transduction histidine kinase
MRNVFRNIYLRLYFSFLIIFLVTFLSTFLISSYFHSSAVRDMHSLHRFHTQLLETEYRRSCGDSLLKSNATGECRAFLGDLRKVSQLRLWIVDRSRKVIFSTAGNMPKIDDSDFQQALSGHDVSIPTMGRGQIAIVPVQDSVPLNQFIVTAVPFMSGPRHLPFAIPLISAGIIAAILVWPLSRRISEPIRELHRVAQEWSEGRMEQRAKVHGNDDISELEKVFNLMAQNINNVLDQRKEFLALISHELKSPLARMRIALELLRDPQSDTAGSNMIAEIDQNIGESEKLIEQLLILSQVEMALPSEQTTKVDLMDVLQKVANRLHPVSYAASVQLHLINKSGDSAILIDGNHEQLERAFGNVLDNAMKFSPEHELVTVEVDKKNGFVEVRVSDRGTGVEAAELQRIFEPFYRSISSNSKKGTGLGLFIARRIVEAHHGLISAQSQNDGGLIIAVQLPVSESQ